MTPCLQVQQLQLLGVLSAREITEPFRKIKTRLNDLRSNGLYQWLHGYIQPSNLSSALIHSVAAVSVSQVPCQVS